MSAMKSSTKAAIYSATVAPGAGFFFLRQHLWGLVFLLPSLVPFFLLMRHYFTKTQWVAERAVMGELPLNIRVMLEEVLRESDPAVTAWIWQMKGVFIAIWIVSIIASAVAGHQRDKKRLR
jgi:hypothetical protein